jgi:hypothetical protein
MSLTRVLLPDPETPVTATKLTERNPTSMLFRLCSRAPTTRNSSTGGRSRRMGPGSTACRPGTAGDRLLVLEELLERAGVHDGTAVLSGAGADVDHVVGDGDGVLVVLHHQHGVAEIAQPLSVSMRRRLSRWCRPIEGSSSTYSTPTSPEPIWLANLIRWASPPASVADERWRDR